MFEFDRHGLGIRAQLVYDAESQLSGAGPTRSMNALILTRRRGIRSRIAKP